MKAKVVKITKMEKKDSYGNTSFVLEFENGDRGFYTSKNEDQKKFVVGQEAEYNLEVKQGSKGPYNKITVPNDNSFVGGGFGKKAPVDPRVQMISFAAAYTKDLIVAGKIGMNDFKKEFENIYNVMIAKI